MKLLNILNSDLKRNASECVEGMEKNIGENKSKYSKYISCQLWHICRNLKHDKKKSCKLLYRCIYLCQQDIKLYASNFNLIVQQKQFTVFDMSKNLFVVVNKCHPIWHLSSCSTCHLLKGMSLWHFHQCRVVTSYGDIYFCWYI